MTSHNDTAFWRSALAILSLVALLLNGCSTMSGSASQRLERHKFLLRLAVTIGVSQFLTRFPQHADTVMQVAHDTGLLLGNTSVDMTHIGPVILAKLGGNSSMRPELQVFIAVLIQIITKEVQGYIASANIQHGDAVVLVGDVLHWIKDATVIHKRGLT